MQTPKRKKIHEEAEIEEDDRRVVPFEALAELTSSEVIEQVKSGMSRIAPLKIDEEDVDPDGPAY